MVDRRQFLRAGMLGGTAAVLGPALIVRSAQARTLAAGTLNPATVAKYVMPLFIPPAMPPVSTSGGVDRYSIAVRQFSQQILPPGRPATKVFGFGSTTNSGSFHTPAASIEARTGRPTEVRWSNQLVTSSGNYVPHFLPVDPTLHWANPPGGATGRDSRPTFTSTPGPYTGPVPMVVHLHGAHSFEDSDGYPEAWTLPVARNIPAGYATVGSSWDRYSAEARSRFGGVWTPGTAVFQYPNDQSATTLWYHSHDLGMTRVMVYAGLAGMYLLRGGPHDVPAGVLPGPAPQVGDAPGTRYHEIPLVIQDRSFNADGSLSFPTTRGTFGDTPLNGPWLPTTDVPPIWNPESFGDSIVVNGRTWPSLTVEPRRYRFRVLNGSNTRTYFLKIVTNALATRPASAALPIWVIGTDGGFLPAPVPLQSARIGSAERLDLVVDFTGLKPGTSLYLINEGPDDVFQGGAPVTDFPAADPNSTGQVMKFVVGTLASTDTSTPPATLRLPSAPTVGASTSTRRVSLNELDSAFFADAPVMAMLGTVNADGTGNALHWSDPVTETPSTGVTETWEINNFTDDAHPIHVHLVQFQLVNRQPFGGAVQTPDAWESGFKDTVFALPHATTRIRATFDRAGRYVWHCHILDHEDNEMMRPLQVG